MKINRTLFSLYRFVPYTTFQQFADLWPAIWAASSFKGAYGETLTVSSATIIVLIKKVSKRALSLSKLRYLMSECIWTTI